VLSVVSSSAADPMSPPIYATTRLSPAYALNQSVKQRSSLTKPKPLTGRGEATFHSTTPGGANPASRSDAGLGGCERVASRVATALVCETRSFSTRFMSFQWRAIKLMDATSAGVSSVGGGIERRRCPGMWSRLIIIYNTYLQ